MYCTYCGQELSQEVRFCPLCGQAIKTDNVTEINVMDSTEEYKFLMDYFGIIVDMEKNLHVQQNVIKLLTEKIESLCIKRKISEPNKIVLDNGYLEIFRCSILMGIIGGPIVWLIIGILLDVLNLFRMPINFATVCGFILGISILCFVLCRSGQKAMNNEKQREYDEKYKNYLNECDKEKKRLRKESQIRDSLNLEKEKMCKRSNETYENLRRLYSKEICYSKYRNLIAVCSIYEYLESGRCFSLTGKEGAYNLFESEIRADLIILKLDKILESLKDIAQNQNKLYNVINDSNKKTQELLDATDRMTYRMSEVNRKLEKVSAGISEIKEETAISNYNTERIAVELEYLNRMELKTDKYKDVILYEK